MNLTLTLNELERQYSLPFNSSNVSQTFANLFYKWNGFDAEEFLSRILGEIPKIIELTNNHPTSPNTVKTLAYNLYKCGNYVGQNMYQESKAQKRGSEYNIISMNRPTSEDGTIEDTISTPSDISLEMASLLEYAVATCNLTAREVCILVQWKEEYTVRESAKEFDVSQAAIQLSRNNIRKKMKPLYSEFMELIQGKN